MVRQQAPDFGETGRVGGVAEDRVHLEFLGVDLHLVAVRTEQSHLVTVVPETLGNSSADFGVSAGDQHVHCHDLLRWTLNHNDTSARRQLRVMLLDGS